MGLRHPLRRYAKSHESSGDSAVLADTRFQVRNMTRDDVPAGKGQCPITAFVHKPFAAGAQS
jgi:hypothetical protein